jgi:tetratricopeptide (TPR) repeat protein
MRRSLALILPVLLLAGAANLFAGAEARLAGKIVDQATGQPIANATIKLEAVESKNIKQETKSKNDGSYAVFVLDGTIRYKFTFSAPGYVPYEETLKLTLGAPMTKDVQLAKGSATPAAREAKADPAVTAYNEGANLANSGDVAGATAKFEEAVKTNPDMTAAWMALAKMSLKQKAYPRAIEAAKKALEIDDEDTDMWAVLFNAYTATGDKANAAIAEKKLPKNAGSLFNDAADAINKGDDAKAEGLLKQAVAADEKFAQAWYELGMVYARSSKNADAKAALTKYLELAPDGKDAATAKEMLGYLK